jgi:hypothetical protein
MTAYFLSAVLAFGLIAETPKEQTETTAENPKQMILDIETRMGGYFTSTARYDPRHDEEKANANLYATTDKFGGFYYPNFRIGIHLWEDKLYMPMFWMEVCFVKVHDAYYSSGTTANSDEDPSDDYFGMRYGDSKRVLFGFGATWRFPVDKIWGMSKYKGKDWIWVWPYAGIGFRYTRNWRTMTINLSNIPEPEPGESTPEQPSTMSDVIKQNHIMLSFDLGIYSPFYEFPENGAKLGATFGVLFGPEWIINAYGQNETRAALTEVYFSIDYRILL